MSTLRYLCSGGRFFNDVRAVENVIDSFDCIFDGVIHGACPKGADRLVDERAKTRNITTYRFPAKWTRADGSFNRLAGFERNQEMVDLKPDFAYFFWDGQSPGTFDCLVRVLKAKIPHEVIKSKGYDLQGYFRAVDKAFGKQGQIF